MRTTRTALALTIGALPLAAGLAMAPNAAAADDATVTVVHGVPGLTVDVFANGKELLPDFKPGTVTDALKLPAGSYDLAVFANGQGPGGTPAIKADNVDVPAGANASVVAHLDAAGKPSSPSSSTTPARWRPARHASPCATPPPLPPSTCAPVGSRCSPA
jgi:hypothetical protein